MKKYLLFLLIFLAGIIVAFVFFKSQSTRAEASDSKLISYELKKLNKMIVLEEYYTYQQAFEGSVLPKSWLEKYSILKTLDHKNIVVLAKGTSQVSYDMKQMKIKVDETNQTLIIQSLPEPQFELFTDVEYLNLDTGVINSLEADELNEYKNYVTQKIENQVDKEDLRQKAHQQLIENLSDIFVLAQALGWKIQDQTQVSTEVSQYLENL